MIRLLDSHDIGDPKKLFCKTAFNDCCFRFKIDLRSQKRKRSIPFKRGFKEMKLCEAVKKWLWAIICKITSSGTKAFRRDWHPAVESQLSLSRLTKNHEKAWVGQMELCLNHKQRKKAGRAQLFCLLGSKEQWCEVWDFSFALRRQKNRTKAHWKGTIWLSDTSKWRKGEVGGANSRCFPRGPEPWRPGPEPRWEKSIRLQLIVKAWFSRELWQLMATKCRGKKAGLKACIADSSGTWDRPLQLPASVPLSVNRASELLRSFQLYSLIQQRNNTLR